MLGRGLLWLGPGPVTFVAGVAFLWLHKQLQATEIGHTVLHGAFNRIEGAERYRSAGFDWKVPIDEPSWMAGHNGKHHGLTNVQGSDPDVDFGHARLTEYTPHRFIHYFQVPLTLLTFPVFGLSMNAHFTGLVDLYVRSPDQPLHFVDDRSEASRRLARRRFFRKAIPYYGKELGLWPLLAGPRFFRVLLGNLLTEAMRDVYTAATIYCGHIGGEVASFPVGTRPHSKGERYAMQVAAANDFTVPWAVSVLCGGLDRQIEHHLFPTLPTNRLREVAPEVQRACEAHGVDYRRRRGPGPWPGPSRTCGDCRSPPLAIPSRRWPPNPPVHERRTASYTIDELSAHTGVPSRTIRFYQSSGALQKPAKRGRIAYYGPEHVERLALIGQLQD